MKKNLRIVSAAAAALLAVAPVAATVVPAASTTVSAATLGFKKGDKIKLNADVKATYTSKGKKLDYTIKSGTEVTVVTTPGAKGVTVNNGKTNLEIDGDAYNKILVKHFTLVQTPAKPSTPVAPTSQVLYTNKKAPLYTFSDGQFNKTSDVVAENQPVHVAKMPEVSAAGVSYFQVTEGPFAGKYLLASDLSTNANEVSDAYFRTVGGMELANNATVYATNDNSQFTTLAGLKKAVKATVEFGHDNSKGHFENLDWDKYIFNTNDGNHNYLIAANATSDADLISQLKNQGAYSDGNISIGNTPVTITIRSNNGKYVNIVFQNTESVNKYAPAFAVRSDKNRSVGSNDTVNAENQYTGWGSFVTENNVVPTITLVQRDSGTFNPRNYIKAVDNIGQKHGLINFDVKSNDVDWTKPGLYSVVVTAKNAAGKTTELNIPVVVSAANGKMMTAVQDANVYKEENGKMVQANLVNFNVLHTGSAVRVYDTKTVDNVQYYRLVSPTTNLWVRADALKNGVVSTPAQETTKNVTIMHISAIYDKNGVATHDPALRAYDTYSVVSEPVTINGAKFYKLAGKDQYIKVGNVDGTSRTLKHNSYVYKSTGKRANKKTLKKGSSVTTYGKSFMIAGHQMYRIGKNQYVKKANF